LKKQQAAMSVIPNPAPQPAQPQQPVSVIQPNGAPGTINLLPVDNAEYRARREEALKKKTQIDTEESKKMMEVLQKGKKLQEDQIEFLKELDQDEENEN
jgi:hypothetical protein